MSRMPPLAQRLYQLRWPWHRGPAPPEDSGPLRALVLLANWWGLVALAWSTGLVALGLACVAALAVGHWFSYHTRHRPRGRRTAVLASLTALAALWMVADLSTAFAGGLYPQAQFGAIVQVITSFDLRIRGNLYSTLLHSLVILYVAADLSFHPLFLVFLVGYSVAALAMLALASYEDARRGSLPLPVRPALLRPWSYWLALGGGVCVGAVGLALLLPRWSSTQLLNSPTVRVNLPLGVRAQTVRPLFPFLQVSSSGRSGFSPTMDLTFRGSEDPAVVLQVRSDTGSYWRGLTFDQYTGQEWRSTTDRVRARRRADGTVPLAPPPAEPGGRRYVQTFFVVQDQPDALFAGYQPVLVQAPVVSLLLATSEGTVQADQALTAGTVYSVVSEAPALDPEALRRDRAADRDPRYLQLPRGLPARVAVLARELTQGAASDYEKALALERELRARYAYDLDLPPLPAGTDAVDTFLFEDRRGFCQQFASALAVMARTLGLPARVVTGYLPGEYNPLAGAYTVRARDAHSWVEIRFAGHGWVPFDPTPVLPAAQRTPQRSGWWGGPEITLPSIGAALSVAQGAVSGAGSVLAPLGGLLAAGMALVVPWLALLLGVSGLGLLARRRMARQHRLAAEPEDTRRRRAVLAQYRALERLLARRGLAPRRPEQTPREYRAVVSGQLGPVPDVGVITGAAERAAYDPAPCPPDLEEKAMRALQEMGRQLIGRRKR